MSTIRLDVEPPGLARITLARPGKRNALSAELMDDLTRVCADLARDDNVRVVVMEADGPVFCAGGDLDWMRAQMTSDTATRRREAKRLSDMLGALNDLPKPLIARVHGDAFGGGVGLLSVADSVIAVDTARFGLTETRLGLIPATISPFVAARFGPGRARRVFFSPRLWDAYEAHELGLVSSVVAESDLDRAIKDEVRPYFEAAPGAVAEAKALLKELNPVTPEAIEMSIDALARCWERGEADEGTRAFFERRKPDWAAG